MNRRHFTGALFSVPLGYGCSHRVAAPSQMRLIVTRRTSNAGFFTALELGYFRDAGIELDLLPETTRVGESIPLVGNGQVDVVSGPISAAMINAIGKGVRMRIVAGRGRQVPSCGDLATIYARKGSFPGRLTDLRELRGKRLECSTRGATSEFMLDTLLATVGLRPGDVQVRMLRREEAFAALLNGGLDVLIDYEADKRLTDVTDVVFTGPNLGEILPNHQFSFLYFGKRLLEGDSEWGVRFLAAYIRGVRAFLSGANPKWLGEYADEFHLDKATLLHQCRNFLTPDAEIDMPSIRRFLEWTIRKGYCAGEANPESLVDGRFLERALQEVGRRS